MLSAMSAPARWSVRLVLSVTVLLGGQCWIVAAEQPDEAAALPAASKRQVDFARDIEPIFASRCYDCHGPDAQEALLRMDARASVMAGGQSGPLLVPGDSRRSLLVARLAGLGGEPRMPLDDEPLDHQQLALVRAWIDQGADWPQGVGSSDATIKKHWAYERPLRPALPAVERADWVVNPIDAFILARLEREGLAPSPPAERQRLIRRVYLDLTGVPPSIEEVDAFVADESTDAYETLVDRLLASPRYGQRWAIPWLDGARYADSNGFQRDGHRTVWPYRDWVVDALNRDMPFDQFTVEQLAGDLLPGATEAQRVATGFHRSTTCNVEAGVDQEENRTNQVIDRVNVTGTIWLGATVECAQCHNHKYDPFTQRDYYRLLAYFNNTEIETRFQGRSATASLDFTGPMMELSLPGQMQSRRARLQQQRDEVQRRLDEYAAASAGTIETWVRSMADQVSKPPQWQVLDVAALAASDRTAHTILDDKSVLLSSDGGDVPDKETYRITLKTTLVGITAIKIETLTHPSLPGEGPGRGDPQRPNFILSELSATAAPWGDSAPAEAVAFTRAEADFSQRNYDVAQAIDGDPSTGWAINPQFHQPHWAVFETAAPLGYEAGTTLTLRLDQFYGGGRTIGRLRISARTGYDGNRVPQAVAEILAQPPERRTKAQQRTLADHFLAQDPTAGQMRGQLETLARQLDAIQPPTSLVMVEQAEPRSTHVLVRGNFLSPGELVQPGTPRVLHPAADDAPPNRLGLARWLVDPANPLVGRVAVNRWWAELFGQGIVSTLEDLGTQCEPPTHPELLDWLAVEFVEGGWSMKHIHKLIVMSNTYRQSSRVSPELLGRDPDNKLLARGPRFRLRAELIRDNALAAAGLLSDKRGGPPVYPPQPAGVWRVIGAVDNTYRTSQGEDRYRRGLYTVWRRSAPYPSFVAFDAPDRSACVVKRPRTNTPLQALTLLNDPVYVEAALALAARITCDVPGDDVRQKVVYGFRRCLARQPTEAEAARLEQVYRAQRSRFAGDAQAVRTLLDGFKLAEGVDPADAAAWFCVANILLNLDEMVTKG